MAFHSKYVCQQCGYESAGWLGRCPNCGEWNSLVETVTSEVKGGGSKGKSRASGTAKAVKLSEIKSSATKRISTKISELDRVLGGGLVPGQAVLIAGEPGIGKSTLLTQLADKLGCVLYVCGEESATQVKVRADRLGVKKSEIEILEETDVDIVIDSIDSFAAGTLSGVVIDSIQTITTEDLSGMAGSVGQVRECAFRLLKAAKAAGIPLFLVGHVTKEGTVAGPAVLAHIVDTVLWFEGDKTLTTRVLRAVKNRFGPTDEVGVFEMVDAGLRPLDNLEKVFLERNQKQVSGSVVTSVMQGTRPILVEIQALVVPTKLAIPRRVAQGIDARRLELLLAVLTRRCGLPLYDSDVFVNVAGGFRVMEPATDLAICLSVASAYFDKPLGSKTLAVGEVGLLGEIREVVAEAKRVKEAKRLGFTTTATSKEFKYIGAAIKKLLR
jgi:DNA repair protein RadA/Sms